MVIPILLQISFLEKYVTRNAITKGLHSVHRDHAVYNTQLNISCFAYPSYCMWMTVNLGQDTQNTQKASPRQDDCRIDTHSAYQYKKSVIQPRCSCEVWTSFPDSASNVLITPSTTSSHWWVRNMCISIEGFVHASF